MVTIVTEEGGYADVRGLTSDEKPVDDARITNGSTYTEIDGNHNVYFFDAETKTWK